MLQLPIPKDRLLEFRHQPGRRCDGVVMHHTHGTRYKFAKLHTIQWEQRSADADQHDLRAMSLPPTVTVTLAVSSRFI